MAGDPILTEEGTRQALCVAHSIVHRIGPSVKVVDIYSSPFVRCLQTARPLVAMFDNQRVRIENACSEALYPDLFAGTPPKLLNTDAVEHFIGVPFVDRDYVTTIPFPAFPEKRGTPAVRFAHFIRRLTVLHGGDITRAIVVFTHGFACQALGYHFKATGPVEYTAVTEIDVGMGGKLTLVRYAAATHLRSSPQLWEARRRQSAIFRTESIVVLVAAYLGVNSRDVQTLHRVSSHTHHALSRL